MFNHSKFLLCSAFMCLLTNPVRSTDAIVATEDFKDNDENWSTSKHLATKIYYVHNAKIMDIFVRNSDDQEKNVQDKRCKAFECGQVEAANLENFTYNKMTFSNIIVFEDKEAKFSRRNAKKCLAQLMEHASLSESRSSNVKLFKISDFLVDKVSWWQVKFVNGKSDGFYTIALAPELEVDGEKENLLSMLQKGKLINSEKLVKRQKIKTVKKIAKEQKRKKSVYHVYYHEDEAEFYSCNIELVLPGDLGERIGFLFYVPFDNYLKIIADPEAHARLAKFKVALCKSRAPISWQSAIRELCAVST